MPFYSGERERRSLKGRVERSSDLRKLETKLKKEGYEVTSEQDLGSTWTKVRNPSTGVVVDFDYKVGRDEYDNKETHLGSIRY